ncbi:MAG: T9SS type A sorting domain-containing protein [Bacteroidetes bacterium]|nr:T9SS type A sorting domain-containing protein [Bacteroidota bacterium]
MRKHLLFIFIVSLSLSVTSQITITSANMPISGDTIRYSNARLNSVGDYTTTGANHVWLFDSLVTTGQAIREFKPGLTTPYFILFGLSAYGEKTQDTVLNVNIPTVGPISITDIYSFYKNTSTYFAAEGLGVKINGIPVPNNYNPQDKIYQFPLDYLDRDSTNFKFSTPSTTLIPFVYTKQGHRITEVDGWGSISTPYGTVSCLRVVTTQYAKDTIGATIGGFPFKLGFPNYQRSYQWLTLGEHIPFLEVSGTLNGSTFNPTQAKYRDVLRSYVGIKDENKVLALSVFPNPSTHQITVIIPKNDVSIRAELVDIQGKTVLSSTLQDNSNIINQHTLDVSTIAKGLYILNLSNLEGKQSLKISIQ